MNRRRLLFSIGSAAFGAGSGIAHAAGIEPVEIAAEAPELTGEPWLNTKPLTLEGRRGKVTVLHFWTFG